jgi:FkbM family methyltransferase
MNYLTQIQGHTLWRPGLYSDAIVVDLGANRGAFSAQMIRTHHCRCYAFEANPKLAAGIQTSPALTVFPYAVARDDGVLRFRLAPNDEESMIQRSSSERSEGVIDVEAIRLEPFLKSLGISKIDVLKMDIEGAEIEVLDSCSDEFLRNAGQVTIEFHDFLGLTSPDEIHRVVNRMKALGFACIKIWKHAWGDALFINQAWHTRSKPKILWSKYWTRNLWGAKRVLARQFVRQPSERGSA